MKHCVSIGLWNVSHFDYIMGILWRKRSLLLKLIVIVGTAWFTIAFLMYTDNQSGRRMSLPLESNQIDRERPVERVVPFRTDRAEKTEPKVEREKDSVFGNVLAPPVSNAGEMGKPVILPTNMSGKFLFFIFKIS